MKPILLPLLASLGLLTAAEKPNVILIMADDLGYGELSSYGATTFKTPNIDKLAAEGQRFTKGYTSASTCTPTRYSLLTGEYAFRKEGTGIAPPNGHLTIDPDTFTLPDLLKKAGYKTAVIGKWHLGIGEPGEGPDWNGEIKPGPLEIGFDHAFLLPTTNDWIEKNKDEPFFLFFASHDIHVPRIPHERFQGVTPHGFRADSIVQLDWCVGELMKTVDRLGLAENTLFVFCSDNGPVMDDGYADEALEKLGDYRAAGPFTGGKYSVYEGGTRTPFITRWKGRIAPGVSDEIVCTIDLAHSLAKLTGTEFPEKAFPDSFEITGVLLGKDGAKGRDHLVTQDNGTFGTYGYRSGDWKLHRHDQNRARNIVVERKLENTKMPPFVLYNLAEDPAEKNNVISAHPEIAEKLKIELAEIIESGSSR